MKILNYKFWFGAVLLLMIAICGQTIFAQKTAKREVPKADDFMHVELSRVRLRHVRRIAETMRFANIKSVG